MDGAADAARGDVIEEQAGKAIPDETAACWVQVLAGLEALVA